MKLILILLLALSLCGCTFALHRVTTTAEVVPCNVVAVEGSTPQGAKGLIDNPEFLLNLAKIIPFVEVFTNKPTLIAAIQGDQAIGVPVGLRLTRHHEWFVFTFGVKETD